ncbi:dynein axonemal heavy chain 14-like [Saccostrea cucullata]|uniref:dynein axonemal heavy chain 14-like n=1 Tax=Saccostrea cuccullata TaxID=36930 RepID=UPI002ED53E49
MGSRQKLQYMPGLKLSRLKYLSKNLLESESEESDSEDSGEEQDHRRDSSETEESEDEDRTPGEEYAYPEQEKRSSCVQVKRAKIYSPPSHDLRLKFDQEEEKDRMEYQRPWPDLENLFGDDPEYQKYLTDLGSYMAMQLEQVKQFSHNFDQYCEVVDKSKALDIDESMARHEWSTEEFNHVLPTFTEMVKEMRKMTVKRRCAMVLVISSSFRDSCLPYPQEIINKTHHKLPIIAIK